jgi:hypothetical protein
MFPAVLANQSDIGKVDGRFLLHNSPFNVALGVSPGMALNHLDTLDDDLTVSGHHDQNPAGLSPIFAAQHVDLVVLLD